MLFCVITDVEFRKLGWEHNGKTRYKNPSVGFWWMWQSACSQDLYLRRNLRNLFFIFFFFSEANIGLSSPPHLSDCFSCPLLFRLQFFILLLSADRHVSPNVVIFKCLLQNEACSGSRTFSSDKVLKNHLGLGGKTLSHQKWEKFSQDSDAANVWLCYRLWCIAEDLTYRHT